MVKLKVSKKGGVLDDDGVEIPKPPPRRSIENDDMPPPPPPPRRPVKNTIEPIDTNEEKLFGFLRDFKNKYLEIKDSSFEKDRKELFDYLNQFYFQVGTRTASERIKVSVFIKKYTDVKESRNFIDLLKIIVEIQKIGYNQYSDFNERTCNILIQELGCSLKFFLNILYYNTYFDYITHDGDKQYKHHIEQHKLFMEKIKSIPNNQLNCNVNNCGKMSPYETDDINGYINTNAFFINEINVKTDYSSDIDKGLLQTLDIIKDVFSRFTKEELMRLLNIYIEDSKVHVKELRSIPHEFNIITSIYQDSNFTYLLQLMNHLTGVLGYNSYQKLMPIRLELNKRLGCYLQYFAILLKYNYAFHMDGYSHTTIFDIDKYYENRQKNHSEFIYILKTLPESPFNCSSICNTGLIYELNKGGRRKLKSYKSK